MEEKNTLPTLENADSKEFAEAVMAVLDEKKGREITLLKISDKTDLADWFVLCSGTSSTHIKALADEVEYSIGLRGVKPISYEGRGNNSWILIDYGYVVVHIFSREAREFYNLDKLYREKSKEE
ncbi:MAG: ribosome silencing factor [Eubacteriales bacterium]